MRRHLLPIRRNVHRLPDRIADVEHVRNSVQLVARVTASETRPDRIGADPIGAESGASELDGEASVIVGGESGIRTRGGLHSHLISNQVQVVGRSVARRRPLRFPPVFKSQHWGPDGRVGGCTPRSLDDRGIAIGVASEAARCLRRTLRFRAKGTDAGKCAWMHGPRNDRRATPRSGPHHAKTRRAPDSDHLETEGPLVRVEAAEADLLRHR